MEIDKYFQELEDGDDFKYFYKYHDEGFEKIKILLNDEDIQKMIHNIGSSDTIELFVEHKLEKRREEEDFESEDDVDTSWMIESDDERIDEDLHNAEVDGIIRDEVEERFSLWELPDGENGNMEKKDWDSDHLEMIDDSNDEHVHKYPNYVKRVKKVTPNNQGESSTKKRGRKPKNVATDPTSQSSQVNSNISGTTTN